MGASGLGWRRGARLRRRGARRRRGRRCPSSEPVKGSVPADAVWATAASGPTTWRPAAAARLRLRLVIVCCHRRRPTWAASTAGHDRRTTGGVTTGGSRGGTASARPWSAVALHRGALHVCVPARAWVYVPSSQPLSARSAADVVRDAASAPVTPSSHCDAAAIKVMRNSRRMTYSFPVRRRTVRLRDNDIVWIRIRVDAASNGYSVRRLAPALPVGALLARDGLAARRGSGREHRRRRLARRRSRGRALARRRPRLGGAVAASARRRRARRPARARRLDRALTLLDAPAHARRDEVQLLVFDAHRARRSRSFTLRGPVDRIAAAARGVALAAAASRSPWPCSCSVRGRRPYFDDRPARVPDHLRERRGRAAPGRALARASRSPRARRSDLRPRPRPSAAQRSRSSGWLATQSKGGGIGLIASTIVVFAALARPAPARGPGPRRCRDRRGRRGAADFAVPRRLGRASQAAADDVGPRAARGARGRPPPGARRTSLSTGATNLSERSARRAGALAGVLTLTAAVAGAAVLVAATRTPRPRARPRLGRLLRVPPRRRGVLRRTSSLSAARTATTSGGSRSPARGTHPVQGIGARGFGAAYLEEGRSHETPARTHSLPLRDAARGGRRRARAPSRRAAPGSSCSPSRHAPPQHPGRRRARRRDRLPRPRLRRLDWTFPASRSRSSCCSESARAGNGSCSGAGSRSPAAGPSRSRHCSSSACPGSPAGSSGARSPARRTRASS